MKPEAYQLLEGIGFVEGSLGLRPPARSENDGTLSSVELTI